MKLFLRILFLFIVLSSSCFAATYNPNGLTTVSNGIYIDPRTYGALCSGYNTFLGDGSTTTFTYTIPFKGSSSTDNSSFMVFYEPNNGFGSATILTTSQFSVTGVNSGTGGTITLNSAVPSGNTLIVVHDDGPAITAASAVSTASGGAVVIPTECTIYSSETNGTQLSEGAQLIGQSSTPNYQFQGQGAAPILRVIAPSGAPPEFGFNVSGKSQQSFIGFEVTSDVPGNNALGFLAVPVLIGVNGASGAGGGSSPGILLDHMTLNSGIVGFGAPIGGDSAYIFAVIKNSNFVANTAGIYGPLSDFQVIGNDFVSNGAFGSYGSAGGWVIGPTQGAPGSAGAGRVEFNRFEFNSEGIVVKSGALINFEGNQFDGNSYCGIDLSTFWSLINITGGWFRGNANGGGSFEGSTTAGKDADICFNGGSGSGGLYLSNVNFISNYGEGSTAPLGSPGATTPPYVLDMNALPANNNNIVINGGSAHNVAGGQGASVTDFAIYRQGQPTNLTINMNGQAVVGTNANGAAPALVRGIPALQSANVIAYGDHNTLAPLDPPPGSDYGTLISTDMNAGYTNNGVDRTDTCDSLDAGLIYAQSVSNTGNPLYLFLPSNGDPGYGGGGDTTHLQDVSNCYMAALSWVTVPAENLVIGQNAACVQAGTWTNDPSFSGAVGVTSDTNASTLTCTLNTTGAPIYMWYRVHDNDGGTFTYSVDSGTAISVNTAPNQSPTGDGLGDTFAESLIRVPYIASGSHTIVFTVTSSTSSSNNVYILGVGTPLTVTYQGGGPTIFAGSMPYQQSNTNGTISLQYDAQFKADVAILQQDGLNVNYVPVKNYMNDSTDLTNTLYISVSGEEHIRDAFEAGIQYVKNPSSGAGIVDPRNYGAACNTQLFLAGDYGSTDNAVTTTAGSPVISINNYTFQAGSATQTGGGDVGKVISIFNDPDDGPTTYIASVDTGNNTATLGINMAANSSGGYAVMGGYPSNPANPATAQDDTVAIQNAATAAVATGSKTFLPNNCLVHNLKLPNGTLLEGNMGGSDYSSASASARPTTTLYIASNGYAEDPHLGINLANTTNVRLKDFQVMCQTFPYFGFSGLTLAGIGSESSMALNSEGVVLDHVSHFLCPVEFGVPFGMNQPVSFTASISGTTMTVSAISSTNFTTHYNLPGAPGDWLAIGRPVTGTGVTSGTVITAAPIAGGTGNYTINKSQTVSSEAMTSAAATVFLTGKAWNNQFSNGGIDINGDFSDFADTGSIFTGGFQKCMWLGPDTGGSTGNAANRFALERFEECQNGAIVLDGTFEDQFTGLHFQFNSGYAIQTMHSWGIITVTGGTFEGNGTDQEDSGIYPAPNYAQIDLGGSGGDFSVTGAQFFKCNYAESGSCGNFTGEASEYLIATDANATINYVSIEAGDARQGYWGTTPYNWGANATPAAYKQSVNDLPFIDTSQTNFAVTSTGQAGFGTSTPQANLGVDMTNLTGGLGLPVWTTSGRPSAPTSGTDSVGYNSSLNTLEINSGSGWSPVGSPPVIPFYIGGLTLSNDVGTPNTVFDIATGGAASDDGTATMTLASAYTKTTGSWVVGSGNGCLDTGTVANSTWYHIFLIENTSTNVTDILCSTSATSPTFPSGYTVKRRIGSIKTDASANILAFFQIGNVFWWGTATEQSTSTLSTTAALQTLNVPTGVKVIPICRYSISNVGNSVILTSGDETDVAPGNAIPIASAPGQDMTDETLTAGLANFNCPILTTNTSGQIRARASASSTTLSFVNRGWVD